MRQSGEANGVSFLQADEYLVITTISDNYKLYKFSLRLRDSDVADDFFRNLYKLAKESGDQAKQKIVVLLTSRGVMPHISPLN